MHTDESGATSKIQNFPLNSWLTGKQKDTEVLVFRIFMDMMGCPADMHELGVCSRAMQQRGRSETDGPHVLNGHMLQLRWARGCRPQTHTRPALPHAVSFQCGPAVEAVSSACRPASVVLLSSLSSSGGLLLRCCLLASLVSSHPTAPRHAQVWALSEGIPGMQKLSRCLFARAHVYTFMQMPLLVGIHITLHQLGMCQMF